MSIYRYLFLKKITSKGKKPYLCGDFVNLKSLIDSTFSDNNNHFLSNYFFYSMKKLFSSTKAYLLLAGAAALMASCQDYEPANEQMTKEAAYNYEFERQFGPVDPNHDWSMATRVTANIDLSDAPEGTYEVKIFSEKNGYLLTKAIVENSAQISFDAIKGESSVRILARKTSALGLSVINGYFPIVDGEVNTAKEGTRAPSTAEQCNTTVGTEITDLGTYSWCYLPAQGDPLNGGTQLSLPSNDDIYYITTQEGQDYSKNGNGIYKVTHNGVDTYMDMFQIKDILGSTSTWKYYSLKHDHKIYSWDSNWNSDWDDDPDIQYEGSNKYKLIDAYIFPYYYYPAYISKSWVNQPYAEEIQISYESEFYYLNDVYKNVDPETKVLYDELLPLVSPYYPDSYFTEGEDNRTLYKDKFDYNVEYVLTEDGPITFTNVFYGSDFDNQMGYFYWRETDNMTPEEKIAARRNARRYVFMNNTYPNQAIEGLTYSNGDQAYNIACFEENGNYHVPQTTQMSTGWLQGDPCPHAGHYVQGVTYHLAYFGEDYTDATGSYTFPEGLHIGFFLFAGKHVRWHNNDQSSNIADNRGTGLRYSIQEMNIEKGTNDKHWWAQETAPGVYNPDEERPDVGEVFAVTYSYKGTVVVGFEDHTDYDENDLLFFISAPINPPHEITTEEENTWIVACEDLGGTYDYDFNDLVFEVTLHTTTTETSTSGGSSAGSSVSFSSEVLFRPLAAGGTLPAKVYLGETEIGEIHALLGGSGTSTSTPINVGPKGSSVSLTGLDPTQVNTGETYYTSIAGVLEDIKIVVTNEGDKDAAEITAPNQDKTSNIPQMLLLPKGWDWPCEQTHIYNVYPEFENWATDMTKNGWIEDPSTNSINTSYYMVNPFK